MDKAIPDGLVEGYEDLISGLQLPGADDRHVLAAAIRCNASVIVTFNQKDFPAALLTPFGIESQHPDEFVDNLLDLDPAAVVAAAQRQRAQLQNPALDVSATWKSFCTRDWSRPPRRWAPTAQSFEPLRLRQNFPPSAGDIPREMSG